MAAGSSPSLWHFSPKIGHIYFIYKFLFLRLPRNFTFIYFLFFVRLKFIRYYVAVDSRGGLGVESIPSNQLSGINYRYLPILTKNTYMAYRRERGIEKVPYSYLTILRRYTNS